MHDYGLQRHVRVDDRAGAGVVDRRVVIVGAGPAGTRCAATLVEAGLRPIVLDEGRQSGGQIYRRQPPNFRRGYAELYGPWARQARALHEAFDGLGGRIEYWPDTLAWNIAGGEVHALRNGRQAILPFDALVLCTGASDRLMPVRGWNRAGVFSLGGAQVALKSQACAVGQRVAFVGTGPLLYLVASQYAAKGAGVAAVLDTSSWTRRLAALPALLALPDALWQGTRMTLTLRRAGVPIHTGVSPDRIDGADDAGVETIAWRDAKGRSHVTSCDTVALGWHVRPETQLADLAGCAFRFDAGTHQWVPESDQDGRSSVPGVYLAGDGVRVAGADAAEVGGRLAALALLSDLGRPTDARMLASLRRRQARLQRFARGLSAAFPWPDWLAASLSDDTVLCRCEVITAGELRGAVSLTGAAESNRAKAFSRVGMGRCQGRFCGHAAAEVIAHCAGIPTAAAGRLRGQAPVKPLPVGVATGAE
jgi:NADPH-dependent 2,4-dienoyl-CoA reductase/sulfur reductase-like enzyme